MATKSAKNGTGTWDAANLPGLSDIQVSNIMEEQVYASSGTSGAKSRVGGLADVTGSFKCFQDPGMAEGDIGALILKEDASVEMFSGQAFVSDISVSAPIGTGALVEWTVTWGAAPTES